MWDDVVLGAAVGFGCCLLFVALGRAWSGEPRRERRRRPPPPPAAAEDDVVVVSGVSIGLPGDNREVFAEDNFESVLRGESRIQTLDDATVQSLLKRNVVRLAKGADGAIQKIPVRTAEATVAVAARLGKLDLTDRFGIPKPLCATMGRATQVAVAAGLEALKDAGLVQGLKGDLNSWKLPDDLRDGTAVVYVSSFPALDAAVGEITRYAESKATRNASFDDLADALGPMCSDDPDAREALAALRRAFHDRKEGPEHASNSNNSAAGRYTYDRKFLFKVLVLANSQLAQLSGACGPNLQTNAACAGTTQALGLAQDLLRAGRCDRVVVVAGDDASGDALLPWLGNGFVALGAASVARTPVEAARPFDARRNGMVLGAAGVGIVVERARDAAAPRAAPRPWSRYACRLVETRYSNSAFHGAAMDRLHIGAELKAFLDTLHREHGIPRATLAKHGAYFSHETGTHATPSSSCSSNEVHALRAAFGDAALADLLIVNTKCLTGHPMGAGVEDAIAAVSLATGRTPPLPRDTTVDAYFDTRLNLSTTKKRDDLRYALRFAAGFGSQVAFALYERLDVNHQGPPEPKLKKL